jgi:hypothetical protein
VKGNWLTIEESQASNKQHRCVLRLSEEFRDFPQGGHDLEIEQSRGDGATEPGHGPTEAYEACRGIGHARPGNERAPAAMPHKDTLLDQSFNGMARRHPGHLVLSRKLGFCGQAIARAQPPRSDLVAEVLLQLPIQRLASHSGLDRPPSLSEL